MKAAKAPPRIEFSRPWVLPLALALFCLLWWLLVVAAESRGLPTLCAFRHLTGLPCPFCGGTRAIFALSEFRFGEAFALNPLATGLLLVLPILLGGWTFRNRGVAKLPWMKILGSVLILNWIWLLALHLAKA